MNINMENIIKDSSFMIQEDIVDLNKTTKSYNDYIRGSSPDRILAFDEFDIGDRVMVRGTFSKKGFIIGENNFNTIRLDDIDIINTVKTDNTIINHQWFRSFNYNQNNMVFFNNLDKYEGHILDIEGILSYYNDGSRGRKYNLVNCNIINKY